MAAFGEGARAVSERHVRLAVADTESTQGALTVKARIKRYLTALVSSVAVLGLTLMFSGASPIMGGLV
jgi:hypothetical protein